MSAASRGMALPLLLLLLLALTALGHGVLLLSRADLRATWAFLHAERAGRAARAGAQMGLERLVIHPGERLKGQGIPMVSGESEDGLIYGSTLRWLDPEFFLLEAKGGSRGWKGERRLGWVGWSLNPISRVGALLSSFEVGTGIAMEPGSRLQEGGFLEGPESWDPGACREYRAILDSLFSQGSLPPAGPLNPMEPVDSGAGAAIPPLGLLTGSLLLARSEPAPSEEGQLEPRGGVCPDGSGPTFVGTEGSLALPGGATCGLLVVGGDLHLGEDASFEGIALVGGDLLLEDGARLLGMARVRGGVHLSAGAIMVGQACPALWVLDRIPVLQEPLILPQARPLTGF